MQASIGVEDGLYFFPVRRVGQGQLQEDLGLLRRQGIGCDRPVISRDLGDHAAQGAGSPDDDQPLFHQGLQGLPDQFGHLAMTETRDDQSRFPLGQAAYVVSGEADIGIDDGDGWQFFRSGQVRRPRMLAQGLLVQAGRPAYSPGSPSGGL